ncbi:HD domain-containing phosphohydrolase [Bradyrhizobium sp. DOA9]|uniref:HD domain-containing phosphohydrolase n=1 Tax=Bradyrhizobium sp. DOA9 TaxID=1126627 RepID=UPI0004692DCE|nr:HD domain-containing phosphohydrolase [Bradyrhizobium sp. DOA9]
MLTQALLVDDSRSVLNFLKRHIEAEGLVEATTFLDPVEALACAQERAFDLVLVDYEMPHMDGISFIRTFRRLPGRADIPIAMITSRQTDDLKMEALQAGATDFLPKQPQSAEMTVRLTEVEMAVIRTHATIGERILADSSCELIRLGAQIAAGHHERWDGAGYPSGLKADAIPIAARVVAVADVFDALTTRRPYKEPMPLEVARDYLVENAGRQFDPGCVEAFLSRWDEVVEIAGGQRTIPLPSAAAPLAPDMERAAASSSDESHPAEAIPTA